MKHRWKSRLLAAFCLTALFVSAMPCASAKNKPLVVDWTPALYTVGNSSEDLLSVGNTKKEIQDALTARLQELQQQKKLPFSVRFKNDAALNNIQEDFSDVQPIGLAPIVTIAKGVQSAYPVAGKTYYKDVVISGLSVAVCSAGTEGDKSWRVLGVIPLTGYDTIGRDTQHPVLSQPTKAQEAQMYTNVTKKLIQSKLEFQSIRKVLSQWEKNQLTPDTWQVEDMAISSKMAQKVFHGQGLELRNILCNYYGAAFQHATGNVVLPTDLQNKFEKKVGSNLYATVIRTEDGTEREIEMQIPSHTITLDLYGINSGPVKRHDASDVREDIIYKAWLRATTDGGKVKEDNHYAVEAMFKQPGKAEDAVRVDPRGIYTEVLLTLANRMASSK